MKSSTPIQIGFLFLHLFSNQKYAIIIFSSLTKFNKRKIIYFQRIIIIFQIPSQLQEWGIYFFLMILSVRSHRNDAFLCGANDTFQTAKHKACFSTFISTTYRNLFAFVLKQKCISSEIFISINHSYICHYFDKTMS